MTPIPLAELRLSPKHHLSALWWLGLLYRRPTQFVGALEGLVRRQQAGTAVRALLHFLPYELLLISLGPLILFGVLDLPTAKPIDLQDHLIGITLGIALGIALGFTFGIALGERSAKRVALGITLGIALGSILGTSGGLAGGSGPWTTLSSIFGNILGSPGESALGSNLLSSFRIVGAIVGGSAIGAAAGSAIGVTEGTAVRVVFGTAVGVACGVGAGIVGVNVGGVAFGIARAFASGIAIFVSLTRTFYLPLHLFFVWPRPRPRLYPYHPVAWDDLCSFRFPGLHRLLVAYAQSHPAAGSAEIERLIDTYPSQCFEALKAKAILIAREAGQSKKLSRLPEVCAQLPEGEKGFLAHTSKLKAKITEIAAIQARLDAMDRPFLRSPTAQLLVEKTETFRDQIGGFPVPLANEFRAAARNWLQIAIKQRDRARKASEREPTAQVFRAGDPVDRDGEAFVPRIPIFERIEAQVMLSTGCPGILLYGRRRVGKSTVLKNLPGFLPPNIRTVSVSMQNPEASGSHALFARHVAEAIRQTSPASSSSENPEKLLGLYGFLNDLDSHLGERAQRLLLGVDEFENIDRKIQEGVFTEDLLDTLRESIQSHRQITWVFSGSHSIDELDGAEWASYLVSTRTVEVPPFTLEETRLLLTEPLKHSRLWDKDDPARPRFSPEMWGEGGIKRIQAETGGWPHLVQLVAETLVDRMNDAGKGHVDEELFERSLDAAVVAGDTVLSQLLRGESRVPGEWEYLLGFRERSTQAPPEDDEVRRSVRRRLLVVESEGGGEWRLRAPLFARWLRKRR